MKMLIVGNGRMGQAIATAAAEVGHEIVATVGRNGDEKGRSLIEAAEQTAPDVAIEFTTPDCGRQNVAALVEAKLPTVSGTTGWDTESVRKMADSIGTPLMIAANYSIGAAVTARLAAHAARMFSVFDDFEPAIVERHHNRKVDAPSGTAKALAQRIRAADGKRDVPIAAVRQGGQPGEHTIYFDGASECVSIAHQVRSRSVFAIGAVCAACWLATEKPSGFVSFDEFLERIMPCSSD